MNHEEGARQSVTPVIEDYLKAIYTLRRQDKREGVRTVILAEHLQVKPPTVTAMLKTLADSNFIEYEPYRGVILTPAGERVALEVIRHHRLIELFLVKALGFSWDEVHDEAEALEHVISEKLEARIAAYLENPTFDPHGDPIPRLDGSLPDSSTLCLADLPLQTEARITRVFDQNAERLRYLAELGLTPGTVVSVAASAPFDGPLSVKIANAVHALDRRLARMIFVEPQNKPFI